MRRPIERVLEPLDGLQAVAGGWIARCPKHEDRKPSLKVAETSDGIVLLHCHAGCQTRHVVEALGLTMADLFPSRHGARAWTGRQGASPTHERPRVPHARRQGGSPVKDAEDPFGDLGLDGLLEPPQRYQVRDPRGRLVAVQYRTRDKDFWWETADGHLGLGGIALADLPLYRSERLRGVPLEVLVVVAEGAKDCDAVWRARIAAVGTMTGAGGTPSARALDVLRDRTVVLWPDNDPVGCDHMERIAVALAGVARETRWLEIPGLPSGAGAADVPTDRIPVLVRAYACVRVGSGQ